MEPDLNYNFEDLWQDAKINFFGDSDISSFYNDAHAELAAYVEMEDYNDALDELNNYLTLALGL